jgi:hypothetical protein
VNDRDQRGCKTWINGIGNRFFGDGIACAQRRSRRWRVSSLLSSMDVRYGGKKQPLISSGSGNLTSAFAQA